MMPVSCLSDVRIAWVLIRKRGYKVFGFLLYSDSDHELCSYMKNGLVELDIISGDRCAIFVIESPSKRWLEHAKRRAHPWNEVLGSSTRKDPTASAEGLTRLSPQSQLDDLVTRDAYQLVITKPNNEPIVLGHLLNPDLDLSFDRNEVWEVAKYFDIKPNKVPCMVFFYDIDDTNVFLLPIPPKLKEIDLTVFFREFFASDSFVKLCLGGR
jgi:hypothetical protein